MSNPSASTSWPVYKRLLTYVKPFWLAFLVGVLANVLYSAMDAAFIKGLQPLIDDGIAKQNWDLIQYQAPLFILAIVLVRGFSGFISTYCMAWVGRNVVQSLREALFQQYLHLPASFHDQESSGSLISAVTFNTEQVAKASTEAIVTGIRAGSFIVFALASMFLISWKLTLIFLVIGPAIAVIIRISSRRFRKVSRNIQSSMGAVTHVVEESVKGYKVVKMFGGREYESNKFHHVAKRNRQQSIKLVASKGFVTPFVQFVASVGFAAVLFFGGLELDSGAISAGEFVTFIGFLGMLLKPLKDLTNINSSMQQGIAGAQSIFEILDMQPEPDSGEREIDRAEGHIRFEKVSFHYPGNDQLVLDDISLDIPAGRSLALVGSSGSGKSTLTSLLQRFYQPAEGRILVDDMDISDIRLRSYRNQIAIVSQHVNLFNDTIGHNIAYGRLGEASEAEIVRAAKLAHAWEFIEKMPEGLDTVVGDDGLLLSGGQRQRLAIARAILKDAPILILDEATSALDTESERKIQKALESLMKNRTTIVIAHRLSTIESADKICVVNGGRIVETGTHQELLDRNGAYTHLYQLQFAE